MEIYRWSKGYISSYNIIKKDKGMHRLSIIIFKRGASKAEDLWSLRQDEEQDKKYSKDEQDNTKFEIRGNEG